MNDIASCRTPTIWKIINNKSQMSMKKYRLIRKLANVAKVPVLVLMLWVYRRESELIHGQVLYVYILGCSYTFLVLVFFAWPRMAKVA